MSEIRAFVGHSFTPNDNALVRQFLDFFDTLKVLNPQFSWQHAESAEPKPISDKVLELLEDKNVFIAICTKKEMAILPEKLAPPYFLSKKQAASKDDFEWQTSDWIVQEIGIAIGRKLKLILIIEDGVRDPGSIQADMEYVRFERENPQKSFEKIAQMIGSLTSKIGLAARGPETTTGERSEKTKEAPAQEFSEPTDDWDLITYEFSMMEKISSDDEDGQKKISEGFLRSKFATDDAEKALWAAKSEYWRIVFGNKNNLDTLRSIKRANSKNPRIIALLAYSLVHFSYHFDAAVAFEEAAANEKDPDSSASYRGQASEQYEKAERRDKAKAILDGLREDFEAGEITEKTLLNQLERFAKSAEDKVLLTATRERIVELWPDRVDTRFSLAYEYSQHDNDNLAFFHYLKIPPSNRDAITWNNLGVSYGTFGISAKAVDAFREAAKDGETLAMSNLGDKYVAQGFLREAEELTKQAVAKENYHKNIGNLITRIKETSDEETKKEKDVLDKVRPKADFFKKLGQAVTHKKPSQIGARWKSSDGTLAAELFGEEFTLTGSFNKTSAGPLSGLQQAEVHRFRFTGRFVGRAISGNIERRIDGRKPTLLGIADGYRDAIMLINEDGTEIDVIESPDSVNPSIYKLVLLL